MMTSNGSSPLTVRGLDPGMMYSVMINVFNGSQVGDQTVNLSITVMSDNSGKVYYTARYVAINYDGGKFRWMLIIATFDN